MAVAGPVAARGYRHRTEQSRAVASANGEPARLDCARSELGLDHGSSLRVAARTVSSAMSFRAQEATGPRGRRVATCVLRSLPPLVWPELSRQHDNKRHAVGGWQIGPVSSGRDAEFSADRKILTQKVASAGG